MGALRCQKLGVATCSLVASKGYFCRRSYVARTFHMKFPFMEIETDNKRPIQNLVMDAICVNMLNFLARF